MADEKNKTLTFEVPEAEEQDVVILNDYNRFPYYGQEFISENLVIGIVSNGESRGYYDKQEVYICKNDVSVVLPNHICIEQNTSDDYHVTLVVISSRFFDEVLRTTVHRNHIKYHYEPISHLTEEQCQSLLRLTQTIKEVSTMRDMLHQRTMLLNLVDVFLTMLGYYRAEQETEVSAVSHGYEVYNKFCDLLVKHYRESREVSFYAEKLNLTPKHFSKVIHEITGHTAFYWIEQHLVIKAKQMLTRRLDMTVQEIGYYLGFEDMSHFSRYFKRTTGMSPRQYRMNTVG